MMKRILALYSGLAITALLACPEANSCTSMLVTKGASKDSSVMITYTCDGEFHPHLNYSPPADHKPGDSLAISEWGGKIRGWVRQVPHTYRVIGEMNEHQVAIGETTFDGRLELADSTGLLEYWDLMQLALERSRTAREAISVMTDLVDQYGYRSTGESFSIGDPTEAWIMEMIGPGPDGSGAEWVALRVPDGYIACHANRARIGEFPLNDSKNCLYSANVISFAVAKGYYDPNSGTPFRFCDAYCPPLPKNFRYADTRIWSIFRRAAPSQEFSTDVHRAIPGARPYPLWIKPDKKLSVQDVFGLMRDHYEGTPYDMTKGIDAGPFGSPDRCRPMTWTVDSVDYGWERSISTPQTAYSFVSQSRASLPDPVGGVYWYGLDNTYTSCYVPLYCGIDYVPHSYTVGSLQRFSWESAWWVFNFVANYANLKYSYMVPEIQAVQARLERGCLELQSSIEKTATELGKSDRALMTRFLTEYSVSHAEQVVSEWKQLGESLVTKYNDGFVKNDKGRPEETGYPEEWQREVLKARPDRFRLQPK
jgi:dipeptidase